MLDVTVVSLAVAVLALFMAVVSVLLVRRRGLTSREAWDVYDINGLLDDVARRVRKAEEGIVDLKVKLEVFELRSVKSEGGGSGDSYAEAGRVRTVEGGPSRSGVEVVAREGLGRGAGHGLTETKERIVDLLARSPAGLSANEVRERIGLSREHVARVMNSLFRVGVIRRRTGSRPFVYIVEEGVG